MFSQMKVVTRLALGFGLMSVLIVLISFIGALRINELKEQMQQIRNNRWPQVAMLVQVQNGVAEIALSLSGVLQSDYPEDIEQAKQSIGLAQQGVEESLARLKDHVKTSAGRALYEEVLLRQHPYLEGKNKLIGMIEAGRLEEARAFSNQELDQFRKSYENAIDASMAYQGEFIDSTVAEGYEVGKQAFVQILILSAVAVLVALFSGRGITRNIMRQLGGEPDYAVAVAQSVAEGDLRVDVRTVRQDHSSLLVAMKQMVGKLSAIVFDIRGTGTALAKASDHVGDAVQRQAAAATQMASSVAEITSTMEEFSASSSEIAESAGSVADLAKETLEHSRKGSESIQTVRDQMQRIKNDNSLNLKEIIALGSRSKEIGKMMELIETLADQTRLIAFNAALEASSAGDAGKRFSVVAAEIRRLADSVTDSTEDISTKVTEIQNSINRLVVTSEKSANGITDGIEAGDLAASSVEEIIEVASDTRDAAHQISLATKQQKTASSQVVVALREIVSVNEHTSRSNQQLVEVGKELRLLSAKLLDSTRRFKLAADESAVETPVSHSGQGVA